LGYGQYFDKNKILQNIVQKQIARVTTEHRGAYEIATADGEYRAVVTGKKMLDALNRDDYPAVGDWVIIKTSLAATKIIEDILPRKTTLHKKYGGKNESQLIATNVDVSFIVESIGRDFNLNRFERYIVLARDGGIEPIIIINKSDLANKAEIQTIISDIHLRFSIVSVITTSTITDTGLDLLTSYIKPGLTYCFLGSSGVGKSSIINKLLAKEYIATKSISAKSGRGRHTTTARQMYFMGSGGIIIDNPGCREVGVADVDTGLKKVFENIENLACKCKFKDCAHVNEPGCAVLQALDFGIIDSSQYQNYQKLHKEAAFYELNSYEKRQKDKNFGKFVKNTKKELDRFSHDYFFSPHCHY